jgi:DNA-binding response OmpR family regulator
MWKLVLGMITTTHPSAELAEFRKVMIVVQDEMEREILSALLRDEGYEPVHAETGGAAVSLLERTAIDLVILEASLTGISGFRTCRAIRERSDVPVLFITSDGSLRERQEGFDAGGDDYILKPVIGPEIRRRVASVVGKSRPQRGAHDVLRGPQGVALHRRKASTVVGENTVPLTRTEFNVLGLLLEQRGDVLSVHAISNAVWGYETLVSPNFVQRHVSRLRRKLGESGAPQVIETVRGFGYVIR